MVLFSKYEAILIKFLFHYFKTKAVTFSYADATISLLNKLGIRYARTIENTNSFKIPKDFLKWHPTCHDKASLPLAEKFVSENYANPQLLYIWGRSFEFQKQDFNRYENIENALKTVSGRNDIWYATSGENEEYKVIEENGKFRY